MSTPSEFDVTVETTPSGVLVLRVVGELDMAASPRVENALSDAPPASRVIVDLTECRFLDSSGLRFLLTTQREVTADGGRFELVAVEPSVLRVLELTNVDTMMTVHQSLEAAL